MIKKSQDIIFQFKFFLTVNFKNSFYCAKINLADLNEVIVSSVILKLKSVESAPICFSWFGAKSIDDVTINLSPSSKISSLSSHENPSISLMQSSEAEHEWVPSAHSLIMRSVLSLISVSSSSCEICSPLEPHFRVLQDSSCLLDPSQNSSGQSLKINGIILSSEIIFYRKYALKWI